MNSLKKVLFIGRNTALLEDLPQDSQLDSVEKMGFYPQVFKYLSRIAKELDYELVMLVDYAVGSFFLPEENFKLMQKETEQVLQNKGIFFANVIINRGFYEKNLYMQSASKLLFKNYLKGNYDMANSYIITNSRIAPALAQAVGCKAICINDTPIPNAVLSTTSWKEIYQFLSDN